MVNEANVFTKLSYIEYNNDRFLLNIIAFSVPQPYILCQCWIDHFKLYSPFHLFIYNLQIAGYNVYYLCHKWLIPLSTHDRIRQAAVAIYDNNCISIKCGIYCLHDPDSKVHGANMRTQVGPMLAPWTLLTIVYSTVQIKENINAPHHWPLCGEFNGDRWIPRTKGQQCGKCFHLMTSSWTKVYGSYNALSWLNRMLFFYTHT